MKVRLLALAGLLLTVLSASEIYAQRAPFSSRSQFIATVNQVHRDLPLAVADSFKRQEMVMQRLLTPTLSINDNITVQRIESWRAGLREGLVRMSRDAVQLRGYLQSVDESLRGDERKGGKDPVVVLQGGRGDKGDRGDRGEKGDKGDRGDQGPTGQSWKPGKKTVIAAGVVTALGVACAIWCGDEGAPEANSSAYACAVVNAECPDRDKALVSQKRQVGVQFSASSILRLIKQ